MPCLGPVSWRGRPPDKSPVASQEGGEEEEDEVRKLYGAQHSVGWAGWYADTALPTMLRTPASCTTPHGRCEGACRRTRACQFEGAGERGPALRSHCGACFCGEGGGLRALVIWFAALRAVSGASVARVRRRFRHVARDPGVHARSSGSCGSGLVIVCRRHVRNGSSPWFTVANTSRHIPARDSRTEYMK